MNHFKNYLSSFKFKKKFFFSFLIDISFWIAIILLFLLFVFILEQKSDALTGSQTAEQLKLQLINSTAEEASTFLAGMQNYILTFLGLIFLYIILFFALFSLSRNLIWNYFNKIKFKKIQPFKWLVVSIITIIIFSLALIPFVFLKYSFLFAAQALPNFAVIAGQIINLIFFLALISFFFVYYQIFTSHHYLIWSSLGKTFEIIRRKIKPLLFTYLFALTTGLLISAVLFVLVYFIPFLQTNNLYLSFFFVILYLAWLRLYLIRILH